MLAGLDGRISEREFDLASLRVDGLEARIQADTTFVRKETERVLQEAATRAERRREQDKRAIATARTILGALESREPIRTELEKALQKAKGQDREALNVLSTLTEQAYGVLRSRALRGNTNAAESEMATRLKKGLRPTSYGEWIKANVVESVSDSRIAALLAQMDVLEEEQSHSFAQRALELNEVQDTDRRAAMTDSLAIELAAEVSLVRRLSELRVKASALLDALLRLGADASDAKQALDAALLERDERRVSQVVAGVEQFVEQKAEQANAAARRRAVLDGLAELGYNVHASMETAWVRGGRLVVARPDDADYGVELGASADGETMQVRVVGVANPARPRSQQRDVAMETKWCGEFEKLRRLAAGKGAEISIRRAVGVGVEAVRTIENADLERSRIADVASGGPKYFGKK